MGLAVLRGTSTLTITHLVFPALFVSDVGVGSITDIMASQTQLCGPEYNALEAPQKVRLSE